MVRNSGRELMPRIFPLLGKPSLGCPLVRAGKATCEVLFSQGDSQAGQISMEAFPFPSQCAFLWQTGTEFTQDTQSPSATGLHGPGGSSVSQSPLPPVRQGCPWPVLPMSQSPSAPPGSRAFPALPALQLLCRPQ